MADWLRLLSAVGVFFSMGNLGLTWYPQDWWSSDAFFELDPFERYIYLECLWLMYRNEGYLKTQKTQIETRLRTQIKTQVWDRITQRFEKTEFGFTHPSVNKRLRKTLANRENGKKGGRPKNPKNPLNNPPLETETETEKKLNRIECWVSAKEAFEEIKLDEQQIEQYQRQLHFKGFKSATNTNVLAALRHFLNKQVNGYFLDKSKTDVRSHFSNWLDCQKHETIQTLTKNA
jgi:hypothetical protein